MDSVTGELGSPRPIKGEVPGWQQFGAKKGDRTDAAGGTKSRDASFEVDNPAEAVAGPRRAAVEANVNGNK